MMRFFWVDLHYACVGIESRDSIIIAAPPIVAWMHGKTLQEIKPWLLSKKAKVIEIGIS